MNQLNALSNRVEYYEPEHKEHQRNDEHRETNRNS
jgi:hypothetical protein